MQTFLIQKIKNRTEVTLNLSSNLIRSSNDETNSLDKLLLTNIQVSEPLQAFKNCLSFKKSIF